MKLLNNIYLKSSPKMSLLNSYLTERLAISPNWKELLWMGVIYNNVKRALSAPAPENTKNTQLRPQTSRRANPAICYHRNEPLKQRPTRVLMNPDYEGVKPPPLFQLPNYEFWAAAVFTGSNFGKRSFPLLRTAFPANISLDHKTWRVPRLALIPQP